MADYTDEMKGLKITPEESAEYFRQPPDPRPISEAELMQRLYQLMGRYPGYNTDDPSERLGLAQLITTHLMTHCEIHLKPLDVFLERLSNARQLTRQQKGKKVK